jgi:cell division protein FtsA
MSKTYKNLKTIACLDIGSSKMLCIIANIGNDGIEILGYGHKESKGISFGAISDIKMAQKSIINVVAEAERMAGLNISKIIVGISGSQILSTRKDVVDKILKGIVKQSDIVNSVAKVRLEYSKTMKEPIHLIPINYRIDDSPAIINPRQMMGQKLYSRFHVASVSKTIISNIENCLKHCQLSVESYVAEPYGSALASLSENELNIGSLLIDIGGSSTSFCIIYEGKFYHVGHVLIGGQNITKDIATILGIRMDVAEKIKNLNNTLIISPIEEKEVIKFRANENYEEQTIVRISREDLRNIIESRLAEIFENIKATLEKTNIPLGMLPNIVLTGGVASTIGIDKLASEIFKKNVRIGYPSKFNLAPNELMNTSSTCALGMLIFLRDKMMNSKLVDGYESKNNWFKKMLDKLVNV